MINSKVLLIMLGVLMLLSIGTSAAVTTQSTTYNTGQISHAAVTVKHNVETNYSLQSKVTVGGKNVTNSQFLYLLTSATNNVANGKGKNLINIKKVSYPTNPQETLTSGTIKKTEYVGIATRINSYINKYGKLPNYVTTTRGKMKYQSMVYMYSKIMTYYNMNKVLPSTVICKILVCTDTRTCGCH